MSFTYSHPMPRSVKVIAGARAVSLIGDEIALIALIFRAKNEIGHWGVAAMMIAGSAPLILIAPVAGLIVDRLRTRRVLIVASALQALVCVAMAYSTTTLFIPLIALLACFTAVVGPAWQALVPTLVTDEQLPKATGLLQSSFAAAGIAGPFLGGMLFWYAGFRNALLVDGATFVLLLLVPAILRADRIPDPNRSRSTSSDNLMSGVRYIASNPLIRSIVILITLVVLTFGVVNVVEIYFTTIVLHAGPRAYGLLGLCVGAGMLVAASMTGLIAKHFERAEAVFLVACASLIACLLVFGLIDSLWQASITLFLLGFTNSVVSTQVSLLLVRATINAEHLRGRIFAAVTGSVSSAQILSYGLGGLLLTVWTPRTIMVVGATASALVLALTYRPVLRANTATSSHFATESREGSSEREHFGTVVGDGDGVLEMG